MNPPALSTPTLRPSPESMAESIITLSLISHTNVGKTTLARTLLRRDVGEALDQPHVTDVSEAYALLETPEVELRLWDTPGFGDTARLLKRLKGSDNPLHWFVSQVWDRFADRPLWCSQQAVRNVREEADIVLYLVNAAEDPAAAGYVALEMEILDWIGKPVIVLLNQTGAWTRREAEAEEEERWRIHFHRTPIVRSVLGLDAFTRCWVQEGELLSVIESVLPADRHRAFRQITAEWRRRNLEIYRQSMRILADQLAASVTDSRPVAEESVLQKLGIGRRERNRELEAARNAMAERLTARTREAVDALIVLHALEGRTAREAAGFSVEHFGVPRRVNESVWTAVGGLAAGLSTGVVADLIAHGLTFGTGMLAGMLGGGAGAYLLAKGYNLAKGQDNSVRWSKAHFLEQVQLALLCYLAVAHFGRGRGRWEDTEYPEHWRTEAANAVRADISAFERVWAKAGVAGADWQVLRDDLEKHLARAGERLLTKLYPEARLVF